MERGGAYKGNRLGEWEGLKYGNEARKGRGLKWEGRSLIGKGRDQNWAGFGGVGGASVWK